MNKLQWKQNEQTDQVEILLGKMEQKGNKSQKKETDWSNPKLGVAQGNFRPNFLEKELLIKNGRLILKPNWNWEQ